MDKKSQSPNKEKKIILQEDCSEDKLKNGILTLTYKKIYFEKMPSIFISIFNK